MNDSQATDSSPPSRDSRETLEKGQFQDQAIHQIHAQLLREKKEPTEGFSPTPIFLVFLFGMLVFLGGIYIAHYSGGFDPMVYNEHFGPHEKIEILPPPPPDGSRVFAQNCVQCHQIHGRGSPGSFPSLVGSEWVLGAEERLVSILLNGLSGPIEVNGEIYNGAMPAFSGRLKDSQIAAVINYIRTNSEWGNKASEVTSEKVTEVRAQYGNRSTEWSAEELLKLWPGE